MDEDNIESIIHSEIKKKQADMSECPTISFKNGNSIAIQKYKNGNNRFIFVAAETQPNEKHLSSLKADGNSEFYHVPNIKAKRDCLYICAPNQAGKTTYLSRYLSFFRKFYPDKPIYVFSALKNDPLLDKFKITRVTIDDEFLENPLGPQDLADSFVIFDDIDQLRNREVRKEIYNMIEEILCNGAHSNINIAITHHLMTNYKETRVILNECSSITIFPNSGSEYQIRYTLQNYYGLDRKEIRKIFNLKTRWVTIFKNYPRCVLYRKGIYLL